MTVVLVVVPRVFVFVAVASPFGQFAEKAQPQVLVCHAKRRERK